MRFFVPGRIEVLGKHTDYAGGRSLLCALDRGIVATVVPRSDPLVRVTDELRGESREVLLDPNVEVPRGDWANYVATVVRRTARNFPDARRGADISFTNDLPVASGMSSSSALVVSIFLALEAVNDIRNGTRHHGVFDSPETLAAYLSSVEMGGGFGDLEGDAGVGTLGGSEDHTAILCCREGFLSQYSFVPTRSEGVVLFPSDQAFVVAFCGLAAEKTGGAQASYNEASLATRRILGLWNRAAWTDDTSLGALIAQHPDTRHQIRSLLDRTSDRRLRDRFDQFVLESEEIIPRAAAALARGDLASFGDLVATSHLAAETLLGNQIPATSRLVRLARSAGADAASAFGAGFGGSVWAMSSTSDADAFMQEWRERYTREFADLAPRAVFFVTRPGPSAHKL